MSIQNMRISLGSVNYDLLETDSDYEVLANKILPKALVQLGEATAEVAWDGLQKELRKSKFIKANSSSSEKRKFIQDGGQNFKRSASNKDKQDIKAAIIAQMKEQKSKHR